MDETIIVPSPNWFLASNLAVSPDGWLIYGGPSKILCVLEPRKSDLGIVSGDEKYEAHVTKAHHDKIVSVDISPEWLEKRTFLTGSLDGVAKQWVLEMVNNKITMKSTLCNDLHQKENEDIVGVGYSTKTIVITVGNFSNIVKWDLTSNVTQTYYNFIKNFKPTCIACSAHVPLNVAVGTKQGVVFLVDLNGNGTTLYKVRGHDDEVMNVSWCPQYETQAKKLFKESEKRSFLARRLEAIRNEGNEENDLEQSGTDKNLPEDSFDESLVQEDDMFDIYKDHEPDEFGHKKYEPEDILVKVKQEKADDSNFLAECLKLKEDILKRKNETEPTIEALVDALDKTHVEGGTDGLAAKTDIDKTHSESTQGTTSTGKCDKPDAEFPTETVHIYKHLLASVGKYGGVRIWSKSGKLMGSCAIPNNAKNAVKKVVFSPTILWYKPNSLLIVDGKSQLLECNPLKIDCKNKLEWKVVHALHKRGMYCIATNAPRVQTETDASDDWFIWTAAQDRNIIKYCLKRKMALSVHASCGGFIYTVQPCPYDAGKVAISVGDGAVRVWETSTLADDDCKLLPGSVSAYWHNVQGKVLTVAWHPTRENLLAFATAEARVGLLDTSSKIEKPARVLFPALNNGVYALCWGEGMQLYASGGGSLVVYQASQSHQAPEQIEVSLEGQKWKICAASYYPRGLLVGSLAGAVAVLEPRAPYSIIAAMFLFTKMIHELAWHPQQTSSSSEDSPYKDIIAASSLDRENTIILMEYGNKEDGTKQLTTWKKLSGHKAAVLQLAWNPHRDELLLSSSQDSTVRVWDIAEGACVSVFGGHSLTSLAVAWLALPQFQHHVLSGGGDFTLRLWDIRQHKAENYNETKQENVYKNTRNAVRKEKRKERREKEALQATVQSETIDQAQIATHMEIPDAKAAKPPKRFLLPLLYKQINDRCKMPAPKKMLQIWLEKNGVKGDGSHNVSGIEEVAKSDTGVNETGDNSNENDASKIDEKEDETTTIDKKEDSITTVHEKEGTTTAVDVKEGTSAAVDVKEGTTTAADVKEGTTSAVDVKEDTITTIINKKGDGIENTNPEVEAIGSIEAGLEGIKETNTLAKEQKEVNSSCDKDIDLSYLKIFGTIKEVNEFLDLEMDNHLQENRLEACIMLLIFRGQIDTMIQFASQRDILCPFLLSMAPCVSFKYWKDATHLYLAQIDRLVARGDEERLYDNRMFGGPKYRKAAILLSMHDVMGAVNALVEGKLFKEAYILCRIRYMDSVAEDILKKWASELAYSGDLTSAAVCNIVLDNLSQAAQVLSRSQDQDCLSLAADIAKYAGRAVFADHVEKKALIKSQASSDKTEEFLKELPSKIELLMKENRVQNSLNSESDTLNEVTLNSDNLNGDTETTV